MWMKSFSQNFFFSFSSTSAGITDALKNYLSTDSGIFPILLVIFGSKQFIAVP